MSRVRIIRVLGNPKKKKRGRVRKVMRKIARKIGKPFHRRPRAKRRPGGGVNRFLVEGHRGTRIDFLTESGHWRHRSKARRFASAGEAQRAMRAAAPKAEKQGFTRLQVVLA